MNDANVKGCSNALTDETNLASDVQFIVITHTNRTMEDAQALYGITMQESGVSTLVNVKFDPVVAEPPTAILTSDRNDIERLVRASGRGVVVLAV